MFVLDKIQINLTNPGEKKRIYAMIDDRYSRTVEVSLVTDEGAWPIPEDVGCVVHFLKADAHQGTYFTMPDGRNAWSINGNKISVRLAPQVLSCPGLVQISATLIRGESRLGVFGFEIHVNHDAALGSVISKDYFSLEELSQINTSFAGILGITQTDPTLAKCGRPADAAAVGAAISQIEAGKLSGIESVDHPGSFYYTVDGLTEWINPPASHNVEYRTTERSAGQPVYMQFFGIGSLPANSSKIYTHGMNIRDVVRFTGITTGGKTLPYVTGGDAIHLACTNTQVIVTTNFDASGELYIVQMWYTKN